MATPTEGGRKEGGSVYMRRLISLVVVALVMAAMMLIMALPAFAEAQVIEAPRRKGV
jgi:hypothetical protein